MPSASPAPRYLELRHEGLGLLEALDCHDGKRRRWELSPGRVTTSLAFFSCATLTDFLGVAELGIIAGGGILLCALAAFTILPAMIAVADRNTQVKQLPKPFQALLLRKLTLNHPWMVMSASLACMGFVGFQAFDWSGLIPRLKVVYDHNLLHLQAEGLESVAAQRHIFESSQHSLLYALSKSCRRFGGRSSDPQSEI